MILEKYKSGKSLRYKLDGKRISAKIFYETLTANPDVEVVDNVSTPQAVTKKIYPDQWTAILQIETLTGTTFYVNHNVEIEGGVFARDDKGATLELHDDVLNLNVNGKLTVYELDIPESKFIEILKTVNGDVGTFTITGNSGKIYTYDSKTLEVIDVTESISESEVVKDTDPAVIEQPAEKLTDFILNRRRLALSENNCAEKIVA